MDAEWFPDGAPGEMFERSFTLERRVQRLDNIPDGEPSVWLSWVRYQDPEPRPPAWFVGAVEQFLRDAFEWSCADGRRPLCGRQLPLLALPVVGTGESGAKPIAGDMIAALISLLRAFVATRAVDVLLVTKSRQMLSAAQATRRRYDRLPDGALRPWAALPPSLEAAAHARRSRARRPPRPLPRLRRLARRRAPRLDRAAVGVRAPPPSAAPPSARSSRSSASPSRQHCSR